MKKLLIVAALIEAGAGIGLICCPSAAVTMLLGSPLDTPAGLTLGRVAGAALLRWASPAGSCITTRKAALREG